MDSRRIEAPRARAALVVTLVATVAWAPSCKARSRAGTGESTGVPECDDYATRYETCLERRPADERDEATQSFASQRSALKLNAGSPEEKRALAEQCRAAIEAIKPMCGG